MNNDLICGFEKVFEMFPYANRSAVISHVLEKQKKRTRRNAMIRQITKDDIDTVRPDANIYAYFGRPRNHDGAKYIFCLSLIKCCDMRGWEFVARTTQLEIVAAHRRQWASKAVERAVGEGYEVWEFSTEAEYLQWALEQLTGLKWQQTPYPTDEPIHYGPTPIARKEFKNEETENPPPPVSSLLKRMSTLENYFTALNDKIDTIANKLYEHE